MSYRRTYKPRRRKDASLFVLFTVACAVLAVVQLVERLWPLAVLGAAGFLIYRGRRRVFRVLEASTDRNELRRQVAKLEQDAARHDQLLGELEDAAGRPVEAVIASYRHLQRSYKTSVPRGTGIGV